MSQRRLFGYCEGRVHDPYVYSEILRRALSHDDSAFQLHVIEDIAGTGGKPGLLELLRYMRGRGLLSSNYKGKDFCCVFFLDKDVDDARRTRIRSPHVLYTELYDLEGHIFRDSELKKAIAIALSIAVSSVPVAFDDPTMWIESKALAWEEWIILCLFSSTFNIDCGCGYSRASIINFGPAGTTDLAAFNSLKAALHHRCNIGQVAFDSRFERVRRQVKKLKSTNNLSRIFKGKWLSAILRDELRAVFGTRVPSNCAATIMSAAIALFDYDSEWCRRHVQRVGDLAS